MPSDAERLLLKDVVQEALAASDVADDIAATGIDPDRLRETIDEEGDQVWTVVTPEGNDFEAARKSLQALVWWVDPAPWTEKPPDSSSSAVRRPGVLVGIVLLAIAIAVGVSTILPPNIVIVVGVIATVALAVGAVIRIRQRHRRPPPSGTAGGVSQTTQSRIEEFIRTVDPSLDLAAPLAARTTVGEAELPTREERLAIASKSLRQALLEKSILPTLRAKLSAIASEPYELTLHHSDAPGLGQLVDPTAEISREIRDLVRDVIGPLTTGTVGLAGPRGAGKTTLLEALGDGRLDPGGTPFRVRCLVSAPVRYDTREFLLQLIRELCELVGPSSGRSRHDLGSQFARDRHLARLPRWLAFLTLAASVGISVAVAAARYHPTPSAVGMGAATGGAVLAALFSTIIVDPAYWREYLEVIFWTSIATAPGLLLAIDGRDGAIPDPLYYSVLILAAGVALAYLLASVSRFRSMVRERFDFHEPQSPEGEIEEESRRLYDLTRLQLSYSSSVSGKISFDVNPIGLEAGAEHQRSSELLPLTLPEIVKLFTRYASRVASGGRILVCIDELDKIANVEEVGGFLNDIKAVFGVPNCCFVVSVSEDALAAFERRGLQQRTAIDSAFDDVIRLDYLDWYGAQGLLNRRVARVPPMFWGLCHVIAGGLPRDLVRTARSMFRYTSREGTSPMSAVANALVAIDLRDRASGTLQAFRALPSTEVPDVAIGWVAHLLDVAHSADAGPPTQAIRLLEAVTGAAVTPLLPPKADKTPVAATSLVHQLAAQAYFLGSVLQVFCPLAMEGDIDRLGGRSGPALLDQLADARRDAMLGPAASWASTTRFRENWPLPVVDRPW